MLVLPIFRFSQDNGYSSQAEHMPLSGQSENREIRPKK
jgi:hypothetical protein